jgi:hypothetical protein
MRPILAALVLFGLSVGMAVADDKSLIEPPTVAPETDVRLFALKDSQPKRLGVLSYYPNRGGGYTFLEGKHIVFFALPYPSTKSQCRFVAFVNKEDVNGKKANERVWESTTIATIGNSKLPHGGLTIFWSEMTTTPPGAHLREDIPIAEWTRNTPDGHFRLSITDVDSQTRLKLKSIVPVLERAEHAP